MTRTHQLVLGAVAAIAVTAGAIALSSAGGAPTPTAPVVSLAGIPQTGAYLGNPRAPVTVAYYSDLQCPACSAFQSSDSWRTLLAQVRRGEVRLVYRGVQTATRDRGTFETQQTAALAAGQQNRLWNFVEQFYAEQGAENSGYVNDGFLTRIARQIPGLNVSQWQVARSAPALTDRVKADERTAVAAGVTGTPTLKQES